MEVDVKKLVRQFKKELATGGVPNVVYAGDLEALAKHAQQMRRAVPRRFRMYDSIDPTGSRMGPIAPTETDEDFLRTIQSSARKN